MTQEDLASVASFLESGRCKTVQWTAHPVIHQRVLDIIWSTKRRMPYFKFRAERRYEYSVDIRELFE